MAFALTRCLVKILAVASVLLVGAAPVAALTPEQAKKLARWAGLGDDVEFRYEIAPDPNDIGGFFSPGGTVCDFWVCYERRPTVSVYAGQQVPDLIVQYVLLHEVGHYLQWKEYGPDLFTMDRVAVEWDADVRAANALCAYHEDGVGAIELARQWLLEHFHYEGDLSHGTMADRVANAARRASSCASRASESP